MKSRQPTFHCSHCDAQFAKWAGRCLECGQWGSITEYTPPPNTSVGRLASASSYRPLETQRLGEIQTEKVVRHKTGVGELDRVLGGGLVPGSFILLGGEPGIGKSTLSLQIALRVPETLYISGEESAAQITLRSNRLEGFEHTNSLRLASTTSLESAIATIEAAKPKLAILDSIQTLYSEEVEGGQGNPNQVRACGAKLMECAKRTGVAILVIGHVTKDGSIAGPKTLEHLVDTVLYFEGDRHHNLRLLRAVKNRFGSTDEIGVFSMTDHGLKEVGNPSQLLLEERGDDVPGSVVTCLMEGTRPVLVEVQALVSKTNFGYPVRKASGFDLNRLHVLVAVLEKRAGIQLGQYDVHVNIVGGIKIEEPAADLAVALAIASAYKDKALGKDLAVFGEVGLGGEIRAVRQVEKRIKECEQLGMKRVLTKTKPGNFAVKLISVTNIQELIRQT